MNILTFILVLFAIVVLFAGAWYFVKKWMEQQQTTAQEEATWPPSNYMQNVGSLCPDYWVYDGPASEESNSIVCRNEYNIPIQEANMTSQICLDYPNNYKTFQTLSKWPPSSSDQGLQQRCAWMQNCGPSSMIKGSWIGMDQFC